jgi:hypothetical protein
MTKAKNLVWMLHQEGLCAVLFRVAMMYEILRKLGKQNRIMSLAPYHGDHYPDMEEVSICQYFTLPTAFECPINTTRNDLWMTRNDLQIQLHTTNMTCLHTAFVEIAHNPLVLRTLDCIVFVSEVPYGNIHTFPWGFTPYSKSLLITGKSLLDLHNSSLAVFHWRRGDQLTERCGRRDKSLNCESAEVFIDDIETRVALFASDQNVRVYIATDEDHPEVLQVFSDKGYTYSKNLVAKALQQNITLTSADSILIDIMLMCVADLLVYYGVSSVNSVAKVCRQKELLMSSD